MSLPDPQDAAAQGSRHDAQCLSTVHPSLLAGNHWDLPRPSLAVALAMAAGRAAQAHLPVGAVSSW